MLTRFHHWIQKRQELRGLWKSDAQTLIVRDERNAYYDAQRLAARCRAQGDADGLFHWAKVAAEIARSSTVAAMDLQKVEALVQEELDRGKSSKSA